jgi:heme/copper-type cytochrome/quinol oxidase subunit 2
MESRRRSRPGPVFWLVIILLATVVAIGVAAWVTGTNLVTLGQDLVGSLYPVPAVTTEGAEIRSLYDIVFFIAAVIFFIVEGLIIWTVLRYRRKPGDDELPPQTHGNFVAELVWTVVPPAGLELIGPPGDQVRDNGSERTGLAWSPGQTAG